MRSSFGDRTAFRSRCIRGLGRASFVPNWRCFQGLAATVGVEGHLPLIEEARHEPPISTPSQPSCTRGSQVLRTLKHPNIIHMEDVFETESKICMVMELMLGGELFDYVVAKGTLNEQEASVLVRKVGAAPRIAPWEFLPVARRRDW